MGRIGLMAWEWMLEGVRKGGNQLLWSAVGAWSLVGEAEGHAQQCTVMPKPPEIVLEYLASWMPL